MDLNDNQHSTVHYIEKFNQYHKHSDRHHHHGPDDSDILFHNPDECDEPPVVGQWRDHDDYDLDIYGPRDHTHDEG